MLNLILLDFIVPEISTFTRADGQTNMAGSTRLLILIKEMYTLYGRERFLPYRTPSYYTSDWYNYKIGYNITIDNPSYLY